MMILPKDKQILLAAITNELTKINGVKALALGGSYATGMATEKSDLDIGIYYSADNPFDLNEIKSVAQKYSTIETPTVTGFYEWGPWVNGGAWIKTEKGKVDFLYKNIDQVAATIENAKAGICENHFEQQPPYGFSSVIFLAETHYNIPLYDPYNILGKLKTEVEQYPEKLKQSVVQQSLWSAAFTIWQAESFAEKADVYNTVGCLTRAVKSIVTALFAINELYPMGDKRAIDILENATVKPEKLLQKINVILCADESTIAENVRHLKSLFDETAAFAQGAYKPYYQL